MRYKIVNVVAFAILNAFTLRKEEYEEDFVVGGVLLLTVVLFKDDEKRAVDKDTTEFETIVYISFWRKGCATNNSRKVTKKEKKSLEKTGFLRTREK